MSVSGDRRHSIRARWRPTPLNLATSAAYVHCLANGGHTPSEQLIEREFAVGMRLLSVCAKCGVPITYPGFRYGGSVTVKALLEGRKR